MKKFRYMLSIFMAVSLTMICLGLNTGLTVSADDLSIKISPKDNETHTYEVYQIFKGDLSSDGQKLSNIVWGDGVDSSSLGNAADTAKNIDGKDSDSDEMKAFIALITSELTTDSSKIKTATTPAYDPDHPDADRSVTITVSNTGYYLVKDKDNTIATDAYGAYTSYILCVLSTDEVSSKSEVPTLTKKVSNGTDFVNSNTACIGDTVTYQLKATVPEDVHTYYSTYQKYKLTFVDTLSKGLKFNPGSVKLYKGSVADANEITAITPAVTTDPATLPDLPDDTGTKITVTIDNIYSQLNDSEATDIIVTYTATLNEKAVINAAGNKNTVYLEYSNDPNSNADGKIGTTPEDNTTTYTGGIRIYKHNGTTAIDGAQFKLVPSTSGIDLSKVVVNGIDVSKAAGSIEAKVGNGNSGTTKGILDIYGLKAGEYTISETLTPDGYNNLGYSIYLKISEKSDGSGLEYTVKKNNSSGDNITTEIISVDSDVNLQKMEILNKAGLVLPATGGIGTTVFYLAGGSIMILAGILFVTKKIVDSKENKKR